MARKLSELFEAANGAPIEWGGFTVRMLHDVGGLRAFAALDISFIRVSEVRPQALRMKAIDGRFEVNHRVLEDIVLWSDSAPDHISVIARPVA